MIESLVERSNYPCLDDTVYLNQASIGLIGSNAVRAMHTFLDDVARHGNLKMSDDEEVQFFEVLRELGSELFGCNPDKLAIVGSASELLGQLPLLIQPVSGSEIVIVESDFPANSRPWLRYSTENDCPVVFVREKQAENLTESLISAS